MEDAHTTILDLEDAKGTAFFGVYDGHGGEPVIPLTQKSSSRSMSFFWLNQDTTNTDTIHHSLSILLLLPFLSLWLGPNVAQYSGEGLHKRIVADKALVKGDYKTAIKNGFLEMDRALRFGTKRNIGGNNITGPRDLTAL